MSRREKVKTYDQTWQEYDRWYDAHPALYRSEIKALQKALPSGEGLEIGVGTGRFASSLSVRFGLDPSFPMLKLARQRNVQVVQGFGEELPFKNEAFHFILVVYTIELVNDPIHFLREATRTLKTKGALVLGILDRESSWGRFYARKACRSQYYSFFRFFSPREILQLFKDVPLVFETAFQTLFHSPPDLEHVEEPHSGFGQGGFVVLKAIKKPLSAGK